MTYDAMPTVYSILSDKWSDFHFKKSKKTWIKETKERLLLLIQIQKSRWGAIYYLNFGAYFLDLEPIVKPLANLPKTYEWHIFARFEAFEETSTADYNALFSLEESNSASLETRCVQIADFTKERILPRFKIFETLNLIDDDLETGDADALDPFRTQRISKKDILRYLSARPRF